MLKRLYLTLLITLLFTLSACGGGEEPTPVPPTETPIPPTAVPAEPEAEPEPETEAEPAAPEVAVDFETISSEEIGVSIGYPTGWFATAEDGALAIASDPAMMAAEELALDEGVIVTALSFDEFILSFMLEEGADPSDMETVSLALANEFFLTETDENVEIVGDPQPINVGGQEGYAVNITGTAEDGTPIFGQIVTVSDRERVVLFVTIGTQNNQDEYLATFAQMLSTAVFSEPTDMMAGLGEEEMEEMEEMAEAEDTAVVSPLPMLPDGSTTIPTGNYIYGNANVLRGATIYENALWTASLGGLTRYDLETGDARLYTTLDGLPNIGIFEAITCPVNGAERLILGTRNGIFLYDAANDAFEDGTAVFYTQDTTVHRMICDRANNRLIFDEDDITIIDLATGERTTFEEEADNLAWFTFNSLDLIDNNIWALTSSRGASRIALDGTVTTFTETDGAVPTSKWRAVTKQGDNLWVSTDDFLYKMDANATTIIDSFDKELEAISFFGPSYLQTAPDGSLWLGFTSNLCQFNETTGACDTDYRLTDAGLSSDARIAGFEIFDDGRMLVYSYDHGAALFADGTWTPYVLPNQAPGNFFDYFYQSSNGDIWAFGSGPYRTDLDVTGWERLNDVFPVSMAEDISGTYWFLAGRNLWQYDGQRIIAYDDETGMADIPHRPLLLHNGNQLYAGGDNGYTVIDISGAEPSFTTVTEEDGWEFGNFRDLATFQGEVYGATTQGLVMLSGADWEVVLDESFVNLPNRNIAALAPTADGRLVLGTTSGLAYFDGTNVTAEPDVTASISDIAIGRDGTSIWAVGFNSGTFFGQGGNGDGGVYHHDGSGWNHITFADGLPMTSPRAVLVDNAGTVWIGFGDSALGGGIFRIVP